jgi:hypothetical protein
MARVVSRFLALSLDTLLAQLARTCILGRYEEQEENLRIAVIRCTINKLAHCGQTGLMHSWLLPALAESFFAAMQRMSPKWPFDGVRTRRIQTSHSLHAGSTTASRTRCEFAACARVAAIKAAPNHSRLRILSNEA